MATHRLAEEHITLLIYASSGWDSKACAGETLFYPSIADPAALAATANGWAVGASPGLAVVWIGATLHTVRPPLAGCGPRFSVAFKFVSP